MSIQGYVWTEDRKGVYGQQNEDGAPVTYVFPEVAGESDEQVESKKDHGYVELPQMAGKEDNDHFCCFSCEYFKDNAKSPTGYRCDKFGFFDRPHGCSDGWQLRPNLREHGEVK